MNKILIVWPVATPVFASDFWRNAWLYEMESYLKCNLNNFEIKLFDGAKESFFHNYLKTIICNDFEVIAIVAPLDSFDGFLKTIYYTRISSAKSKIFVYGVSTFLQPDKFKELDIDAFTVSGDFEIALESYINSLTFGEASGVLIKNGESWRETGEGKYLTPNKWEFVLKERIAEMDVGRLTIAKGCVGSCNFCCCTILHGTKERRKSVEEVIEYLKSLDDNNKIIEFSAPSFTSDRKWVERLCYELIAGNLNLTWRCVTRIDMLDDTLIKKMSEAGCYRIGIGLETVIKEEQNNLGKSIKLEKTIEVIASMNKNFIEPLVFLIAGIPKQKIENFKNTVKMVKKWGGIPRITAYVDYNNLNFNNAIRLSIDSDMTTSSLYDYKENEIGTYLKYILDTCDNDSKQYNKILGGTKKVK